MGTRNVTLVSSGGEIKVAQYGQWDGHPSTLGVKLVAFIQKTIKDKNLDKLREAVDACAFISKDKVAQYVKECGGDHPLMVTMEVAHKLDKKCPQLSRNMGGAELLPYLLENGGVELIDSSYFTGDSIFCEWAYVVDLDRETLEVYRGFNKEPLGVGERFRDMPISDYNEKVGHYPVKLVFVVGFGDLNKKDLIALEKSIGEENDS